MSLRERIKIIKRKRLSDPRGWFLKVITGTEDCIPNSTGEVYLISADVNECRANHYHDEANEWFTLVKGCAELILEDIFTKERVVINLDENNPTTIFVPNKIGHSFRNTGSIPYILVTYTDKLFVPEDTIDYQLC